MIMVKEKTFAKFWIKFLYKKCKMSDVVYKDITDKYNNHLLNYTLNLFWI